MTSVYGKNNIALRKELWEDLRMLENNMQDAWCVLGDFNAVLAPEGRIGGRTSSTWK